MIGLTVGEMAAAVGQAACAFLVAAFDAMVASPKLQVLLIGLVALSLLSPRSGRRKARFR